MNYGGIKKARMMLAAVMLLGLLALLVPVASLAEAGVKPPDVGDPNIDCPDGTTLVAKYEWKDSGYVFEKPPGGDEIVKILAGADAAGGGWESIIGIGVVILKGSVGTHSYTYAPPAFSGTFSKEDLPLNPGGQMPNISNIQFCSSSDGVMIVLDPKAATNHLPEETSHEVTATVVDLEGKPKVGVVVMFEIISGPNMGVTGFNTTDENGEATFSYSSNGTEGTDTIRAWIDGDGGTVGVYEDGIDPNDEAEKTWERETAVTLVSFTAAPGVGAVALAWETGTEVDNAGFNVYRATGEDGPYAKVNAALIAAEGDPVAGANYILVDEGLKPGTYYYKLEDVDTNGVTTLYGPVLVRVLPSFRRPVYRPRLPF